MVYNRSWINTIDFFIILVDCFNNFIQFKMSKKVKIIVFLDYRSPKRSVLSSVPKHYLKFIKMYSIIIYIKIIKKKNNFY